MSNKIFKNYQVNVGIPFQVRPMVNFHTLSQQEPEYEGSFDNEDNQAEEYSKSESAEDIIAKAKEEADLIIREAQLEAMRLLENTEAEANESRIAIEDEARKNGYEDGFNEAKRQCEDILQEAEFVREHAKAEYNEVLQSIEADAVNMIMEIAKKVIYDEISLNKENIFHLVKQAFEKSSNKENVVLKVSPEDHDFISENMDKLLGMLEGVGEVEIKKDASLKAGGCLIETPYGSIDAGVQTKLKKIEEAFRAVIGC